MSEQRFVLVVAMVTGHDDYVVAKIKFENVSPHSILSLHKKIFCMNLVNKNRKNLSDLEPRISFL